METKESSLQTKGREESIRYLGGKNIISKKYYQTAEIEEEIKEYGEDDVKKTNKKVADEDEKSIVDLLRLPAGMHSRT